MKIRLVRLSDDRAEAMLAADIVDAVHVSCSPVATDGRPALFMSAGVRQKGSF